jgi:hypothetical protein
MWTLYYNDQVVGTFTSKAAARAHFMEDVAAGKVTTRGPNKSRVTVTPPPMLAMNRARRALASAAIGSKVRSNRDADAVIEHLERRAGLERGAL